MERSGVKKSRPHVQGFLAAMRDKDSMGDLDQPRVHKGCGVRVLWTNQLHTASARVIIGWARPESAGFVGETKRWCEPPCTTMNPVLLPLMVAALVKFGASSQPGCNALIPMTGIEVIRSIAHCHGACWNTSLGMAERQ